MNKLTGKARTLAGRFGNEDQVMQELSWNEKDNTFRLNTMVDENTVISEPISKEDAYTWYSENKF